MAQRDVRPGNLVGQTLGEGLAAYFAPQANKGGRGPRLLILDQFEELFTTHSDRYPERAGVWP